MESPGKLEDTLVDGFFTFIRFDKVFPSIKELVLSIDILLIKLKLESKLVKIFKFDDISLIIFLFLFSLILSYSLVSLLLSKKH